MKIIDISLVIDGYLPIHIYYNTTLFKDCTEYGSENTYDCAFDYGDERDCDGCEYAVFEKGEFTEFLGEARDLPIRLKNYAVKRIDIRTRKMPIKGSKRTHEIPVLEIEVKEPKHE